MTGSRAEGCEKTQAGLFPAASRRADLIQRIDFSAKILQDLFAAHLHGGGDFAVFDGELAGQLSGIA